VRKRGSSCLPPLGNASLCERNESGVAYAERAFVECWAAYRSSVSSLGYIRTVTPFDRETRPLYSRRGQVRAIDFIIDFECIGCKSVTRPDWGGRRQLFESYVLRCEPYSAVKMTLGITRGTMNRWLGQIRRIVGKEIVKRGLWPVDLYYDQVL
jgi:hypothetical protein